MARRKLASISGVDPEYTRKFQSTKVEPAISGENALPADEAVDHPTVALQSVLTKEPPQPEPAEERRPEPSQRPRARRQPGGKRSAKSNAVEPVALLKPKSARSDGVKTVIDVRLSALERHQSDLDMLAGKGLPTKDVLIFAGKRMLATVELNPAFVPPSDEKRLTTAQYAYRSTKAVEDSLLSGLARKYDPLGVRGKYAMVQGQFEAQFWDELDRVIDELKQRG